MGKVIQISLLTKISGNVNADESIGTRITLKKMYNSEGEVLPFVSARAVKYSIRRALKEKGYKIDPYLEMGENARRRGSQQQSDSANPKEYIDNDLFGYMKPGKQNKTYKRQAPIAIGYLKALKDTPISVEFGARFPREGESSDPTPFEIEVAEFIGRLNVLIYDYVGKQGDKSVEQPPEELENWELELTERKKRLQDFLNILLTPAFVLPRKTNSLNIPELITGFMVLSDNGPQPIYQYLDYETDNGEIKLKENLLKNLKNNLPENSKLFILNYGRKVLDSNEDFKIISVKEAVEKAVDFYFS